MTKKDKIRQEIEILEQENGELRQDLQRTRADFENFRKNVEIDKNRLQLLSKQSIIMQILPIMDDLKRGLDHMPTDLASNTWAQGIVTLHKKITNDLNKIGVVIIKDKIGDIFDPEKHEAIVAEGEGEQAIIAEILRDGYLYQNEVIRPTIVKVENRD